MTRSVRSELTVLMAFVTLCAAAPAAAQPVDELSSYSYVRTLEGRASLASVGRGPGEEADLNQPLLQGDAVRVERGARLEIALADRNIVRIAGDSTLNLVRVAFSADRDDRTTRLDLEEGEIVLVVTDEALGDELPEIRTPAGRVFIHQPGTYRLRASATGELELIVRSGFAELLTERGSTVVRTGEEAWVRGDRWGGVDIATAGPLDALERWGRDLDYGTEAVGGRTLHVEPYLAYAAAPLERHGTWVYVDASWYWRPRVTVDWRPYWNGRWAWTPSGMTWISAEPWGWLPYHYGTWTIAPGYGWVWRPGRVYSPAWVYWYVGPRWTGWCPVGYYADYYRSHRRGGLRFGLYGWAGGSWGLYADWNFSPTHRMFDRHGRHHRRTGAHLRRTEGRAPRGLLTTDTRFADRHDWTSGDGIVEKIGRGANARLEHLPEVTEFVARQPTLSTGVVDAISVRRAAPSQARIETPLGPAAGGRGRPAATVESAVDSDGVPTSGWRSRSSAPVARSISSRGRPAAATDDRAAAGADRELRGRSPSATGARERDLRTAPPASRGRADSTRGSDPDLAPSAGQRGRGTGVFGGDRQGWRRDAPASPPRPSSDLRDRRPTARRSAPDEPVSRVIGGVRRGAPEATPSNPGASGRRPEASDGLPEADRRGRSRPVFSNPRVSPPPAPTAPVTGGGPSTRPAPRADGSAVRSTPPTAGARPAARPPAVQPPPAKPSGGSASAKPAAKPPGPSANAGSAARGGSSAKSGSDSKQSKSDPEPPARSRSSRGKRGGGGG